MALLYEAEKCHILSGLNVRVSMTQWSYFTTSFKLYVNIYLSNLED